MRIVRPRHRLHHVLTLEDRLPRDCAHEQRGAHAAGDAERERQPALEEAVRVAHVHLAHLHMQKNDLTAAVSTFDNALALLRVKSELEEACTLPILWCTIRLALAECMQLAVKQGILIHASTGGVGLVAHEFAQRIGAAVSGSVGRPSKVAHMRTLGVVAVATSRDAVPFAYGAAAPLAGG